MTTKNITRRLFLFSLAVLPVLMAAPAAQALETKEYGAYAPPNAWGAWTNAGSNWGRETLTIRADPLGKTLVLGEVRYYDATGKPVVQPFRGAVRITTGDVAAVVEVRFKGVPLGSAVRVLVTR